MPTTASSSTSLCWRMRPLGSRYQGSTESSGSGHVVTRAPSLALGVGREDLLGRHLGRSLAGRQVEAHVLRRQVGLGSLQDFVQARGQLGGVGARREAGDRQLQLGLHPPAAPRAARAASAFRASRGRDAPSPSRRRPLARARPRRNPRRVASARRAGPCPSLRRGGAGAARRRRRPADPARQWSPGRPGVRRSCRPPRGGRKTVRGEERDSLHGLLRAAQHTSTFARPVRADRALRLARSRAATRP